MFASRPQSLLFYTWILKDRIQKPTTEKPKTKNIGQICNFSIQQTFQAHLTVIWPFWARSLGFAFFRIKPFGHSDFWDSDIWHSDFSQNPIAVNFIPRILFMDWNKNRSNKFYIDYRISYANVSDEWLPRQIFYGFR